MTVYDSDATLPALPVPSLEDTCEQIKEMARPLNSREVWQATCAAADALKSEGIPLQKKLVAQREALSGPANASWLRPLWDSMYLTARGPLPIEVNYVLELKRERWGRHPLSAFIVSMCRFFQAVGQGDLAPEAGRGGPLSMDSLRFMAYTRIPRNVRDTLHPAPLDGPATVAVVHRGQWYVLTISDASGRMTSVADVECALSDIRAKPLPSSPPPPIGALTTTDRDTAAALRTRLLAHPYNRDSLSRLSECLFAVALEEAEPGAAFGNSLIAGDAANRWFDKSLQIITSPGGEFGANFEHSGCDAGYWIYALNWVDEDIHSGTANSESGIHTETLALTWEVDDSLAGDLRGAAEAHGEKAARMPTVFRSATSVNRDIVKSLGCGPDIFCQLAFQTAYRTITGEFASAYEAVAVRNFYQGRTECARPATASALAFAEAVATGQTGGIRALYQKADAEHKARLTRCQQGLGVDRHMFGLRSVAEARQGTSLPALFTDAGWLACARNTLSTSSVTAPCVRFFGFGPVLADGLGIGYAMVPECLQLAVTSLPDSRTDAASFVAAVEGSLARMAHILEKDK